MENVRDARCSAYAVKLGAIGSTTVPCRSVRHLLARRKARHVDLACRWKERQPTKRVKDLDRRIDDEYGAIVRQNPGTLTQGGKRVREVVVDKKEEDEVHFPLGEGKRLGGRTNPADCFRLRNRSRGCQHPLRPINTRHGRSEHLPKKRRESSDATTQVNDASNINAVKLTTQNLRPHLPAFASQGPYGSVGLVDVQSIVVKRVDMPTPRYTSGDSCRARPAGDVVARSERRSLAKLARRRYRFGWTREKGDRDDDHGPGRGS